MSYWEYISSSAWRNSAARLDELRSADFRCRACFAEASDDGALEVHHRTYQRLGHEKSGDLTTLCGPCHRTITNMLRRRRYASATPMIVDIVPLIENRPGLFDPTTAGVSS